MWVLRWKPFLLSVVIEEPQHVLRHLGTVYQFLHGLVGRDLSLSGGRADRRQPQLFAGVLGLPIYGRWTLRTWQKLRRPLSWQRVEIKLHFAQGTIVRLGVLGVHEVVGPHSFERPDVLSEVSKRIRQLTDAPLVLS